MNDGPVTYSTGDWVAKIREPETAAEAPVVLLLHGWTGDEDSMWVFSNKLSRDALLIAPRGLFPSRHAERSGYSWVADNAVKFAPREAFEDSIVLLDGFLSDMASRYRADFENLNLVGFSQGAAFASAFTFRFPERVSRLALLSGFTPEGITPSEADLSEVKIFIGHGSLDDIVPEEKARSASLLFQAAGGDVHFCLTEVGHKLGADCFHAFNHFFRDI